MPISRESSWLKWLSIRLWNEDHGFVLCMTRPNFSDLRHSWKNLTSSQHLAQLAWASPWTSNERLPSRMTAFPSEINKKWVSREQFQPLFPVGHWQQNGPMTNWYGAREESEEYFSLNSGSEFQLLKMEKNCSQFKFDHSKQFDQLASTFWCKSQFHSWARP